MSGRKIWGFYKFLIVLGKGNLIQGFFFFFFFKGEFYSSLNAKFEGFFFLKKKNDVVVQL